MQDLPQHRRTHRTRHTLGPPFQRHRTTRWGGRRCFAAAKGSPPAEWCSAGVLGGTRDNDLPVRACQTRTPGTTVVWHCWEFEEGSPRWRNAPQALATVYRERTAQAQATTCSCCSRPDPSSRFPSSTTASPSPPARWQTPREGAWILQAHWRPFVAKGRRLPLRGGS